MKLGRTLIPITFNVEGREVKVREISELKKYFNSNHVKDLLKALHYVEIEQFFYAHGRDELKDLIVELKKKNTPGIEILNQVAEMLGLDRFQVQGNYDFTIISDKKELKEIIEIDAKEIHLTSGSWKGGIGDIHYKDEKELKGDGENKTFIFLQDLELSGGADQWLTFENLTITSDAEPGTLNIKNAKVRFRKVSFYNLVIKAENSVIELTEIESNSEKPLSIEVNNSTLNIVKCKKLVFNQSIIVSSGNLLVRDSEFKYGKEEPLFNLDK